MITNHNMINNQKIRITEKYLVKKPDLMEKNVSHFWI